LRDLATQKPDDPRNWFHHGQVHCWYCSGAVTLVPATGTGKKPDAINLKYSRVYIATRQ
jgi:hypothetical protein